MFGHAIFGWDPFAVDWFVPAGATATPAQIPGGHRRKEQGRKKRKRDEERMVETVELSPEELAALDRGFRENHPQPVLAPPPDAVPVYVAPPDAVGLGPVTKRTEPSTVSPPSVTAALFEATATEAQRRAAFTFFDRLETAFDRDAKERATTKRHLHAESIRYAQTLAQAQRAERMAADERHRLAEEDEMVNLLMLIDELDL